MLNASANRRPPPSTLDAPRPDELERSERLILTYWLHKTIKCINTYLNLREALYANRSLLTSTELVEEVARARDIANGLFAGVYSHFEDAAGGSAFSLNTHPLSSLSGVLRRTMLNYDWTRPCLRDVLRTAYLLDDALLLEESAWPDLVDPFVPSHYVRNRRLADQDLPLYIKSDTYDSYRPV